MDGNKYTFWIALTCLTTGFSIIVCSFFDAGMTMLVKIQILSLFLDRDLKEELWVSTSYFQTISVSTSPLMLFS